MKTSDRTPDHLTPEQVAELDALAALPDAAIDTSDIPEITEFSNPRRGRFALAPNTAAKLDTPQTEPTHPS